MHKNKHKAVRDEPLVAPGKNINPSELQALAQYVNDV